MKRPGSKIAQIADALNSGIPSQTEEFKPERNEIPFSLVQKEENPKAKDSS